MNSFSNTTLRLSGSKEKELVLGLYAELSRKHYCQILNNELEICLPPGVTMKNKAGSRGLFFECVNTDTTEVLKEGLDASGINWQEN